MTTASLSGPELTAAADRLRSWLLSGAVQCDSGVHAGGVFGAFDADGTARYVYPEITGYYLHWLADVARDQAAERPLLARAAQAAADWTTRQFENGAVPATRAYVNGETESDWRNDAVFFFDLAMLLRGLCAATETGLITLPRNAVERVLAELARLVDETGEIRAARRLTPDARLPVRWSTVGGPFEVKASSRVTLAARHITVPPLLAQACTALAQRYAAVAAQVPLEMLHPTLYFAEGILVADPTSIDGVRILLQRLLALQNADGSLPEAEDSTVPRSDIIAQALRIALLTREGAPTPAMASLARALVQRIAPSGVLTFRPDAPQPQPNVWCAMFAEQALRWQAGRLAGHATPAAEWLV
ncbi:hypothetical protein [Tahibacter amnicola]|uniref:Uncharacterized protein n=1 Tax=Tahibacter amnicola TaxID=2976241 RepID=A0ABY6BIV6_9GAMM|nr:hypothetical protein [Tahibacter amnicola]UXI69699.1 hypothetical protein N4264_08725 [Tahibacter amnicola]